MKDSEEIFFVRWWGLVLSLVLLTGVLFALTQGWFLDREAENVRHSNQYLTTHQTALRSYYTQYQSPDLSVPQKRALFLQMRYEADLIPRNVPEDILSVLSQGAPR